MFPLRFVYLFGSSLFFIPWFLIFSGRKDLRRLMVFNGLLLSVIGLIMEYFFWTRDWWRPYTITNTRIGIEDILLGFSSGGVAASLYFYVFKNKLKTTDSISNKRLTFLIVLISVCLMLCFILVYIVNISSFLATIIFGLIFSTVIMFFNKSLIKAAFVNAILLVLLVVPIFQLMIFVSPGFIENTWMTENLMGTKILSVPIEDYVFYFLCGIVCFLIYPFLDEKAKLIKIK
ncbi:MAG: lycopene cyclase domain-containing protein [Candidatus Shapirobacteria bacterium]|jgi:hypothetical protein